MPLTKTKTNGSKMKKRVLIYVTLPPPVHGSNTMNQHVVDYMANTNAFDVEVLPLHYATSIKDIGIPRIGKIFSFIKYGFMLLKTLHRFRPDVVYFPIVAKNLPFYRDCFYVLLMKLYKTHIIYHLHLKGIKEKTKTPFIRGLYKWAFNNASVILLSPILYTDMDHIIDRDQAVFVANGIPQPKVVGNAIKKEMAPEPKILFLSNLVITKGPFTLLKACQILKDRGYPFQVEFVGNPAGSTGKNQFERLIKAYGIEDNVTLPGPKYNDEKDQALSDADIFVFPSWDECFPLVLLEAMSHGLPVVSTYEGAIPEIIDNGRTGFLVEKKNPEDLADKIAWLIDHPHERTKMGQAGLEKYLTHYTLHHFQQKIAATFHDIALAV